MTTSCLSGRAFHVSRDGCLSFSSSNYASINDNNTNVSNTNSTPITESTSYSNDSRSKQGKSNIGIPKMNVIITKSSSNAIIRQQLKYDRCSSVSNKSHSSSMSIRNHIEPRRDRVSSMREEAMKEVILNANVKKWI